MSVFELSAGPKITVYPAPKELLLFGNDKGRVKSEKSKANAFLG